MQDIIQKNDNWGTISIREKFQLVNGTVCIIAAIGLYFLSYLLTLTIGGGVISASASLLASGCALFGLTSYVKESADNVFKQIAQDYQKQSQKENG